MRLTPFDAPRFVWPLATALIFGSLAVVATLAEAKTVQVPATQPKVLLDVPDDWTVAPTDSNFEFRSPDKTSIVIVGIVKRTKEDVVAWHKMATAKMVAFGVKFDPTAAATPALRKSEAPKPAKPNLSSLGIAAPAPATQASTPTPGGTPDTPVSAAPEATSAAPPMTVFSGAPSIAVPGQPPAVAIAKDDQPEPAFSMGQFAGPAELKAGGKMPFKIAFLYGASLEGKPVDSQFFNFGLSKDASFLLQQESTPTDNRAIDIAKSVRRAP